MPPLRNSGPVPEAEHPEYAGQYRLEACLGSGGMGIVHFARSASGLALAVKVVHRQYAADPEFRARFRQEVAAARRVSGAFTAPVVDADPDAVRPWMATLHVPGPTLAAQVKRNGPMSPAELRRLTAGLAEALRDIHRAGVVHRDLKPGNVLLTDAGPKVIDFGISRPTDSDLRTETGKLIGSPPFMAPEQFQRPREVGPAADVFALGSVLVHAATGRGPFDSDSPYIVAYQVVHDAPDLTGVPEDLTALVEQCLAKDPADRPTPDDIMAALKPPSYEAAAFVPAQRRGGGDGLRAGGGVRAGGGGGAGPGVESGGDHVTRSLGRPAPEPSDGESGDRTARYGARRRRATWVTAVLALCALVVGGAVAVQVLSTSRAPSGPVADKGTGGSGAFVPWRTGLTTKDGAPPACSLAGAALYCSAPGIGAARLDPTDGRVLWSRKADTGDAALSAPPVAAGVVLGAPFERRVQSYDTTDGARGWGADVSAYQGRVYPAGRTVLLVSADGTVRALDTTTGKERWRRAVAGHPAPAFELYDADTDTAYVAQRATDGTSTLVAAVGPATGAQEWERRLPGTLTPVAAVDGVLHLASTDLDSRTDALVRYDPRRGSVRRVPLPYPIDEPQIALRGDTAYLLSPGGTLLAVGTGPARDGESAELWHLETGAARTSRPVVAGRDRLYFSAADGRLLAVDTARGVLLGGTEPRLRAGKLGFAPTLPAPVPAHGKVFATAPDGSVFAVKDRDPARW
ncbi:PQQ-binding-like beta-propeller repeat protein [Streptomyces flavidovirens]|uniref:serine/threonine-protein kinase n=1 Tax=Streptomyces flavidovirens TaxID=67298 RepID=UPI00344A7E3D